MDVDIDVDIDKDTDIYIYIRCVLHNMPVLLESCQHLLKPCGQRINIIISRKAKAESSRNPQTLKFVTDLMLPLKLQSPQLLTQPNRNPSATTKSSPPIPLARTPGPRLTALCWERQVPPNPQPKPIR